MLNKGKKIKSISVISPATWVPRLSGGKIPMISVGMQNALVTKEIVHSSKVG